MLWRSPNHSLVEVDGYVNLASASFGDRVDNPSNIGGGVVIGIRTVIQHQGAGVGPTHRGMSHGEGNFTVSRDPGAVTGHVGKMPSECFSCGFELR